MHVQTYRPMENQIALKIVDLKILPLVTAMIGWMMNGMAIKSTSSRVLLPGRINPTQHDRDQEDTGDQGCRFTVASGIVDADVQVVAFFDVFGGLAGGQLQ